VVVARQLADLAAFAPGRLVFGVGVGGEDPHEVASCGVDPRTRGRRTDAGLAIVRGLLAGEAVTHHDEFFDLDEVVIRPVPGEPVPIIVGGRSDAAVRRAGRLGDGWLGVWCSPRRFGEVVAATAAEAEGAGRAAPPDRHAMQVCCGIAATDAEARAEVAPAMERMYGLPFERFERYSPAGPPERIAEALAAYVEAGCRSFNLIPQTPDEDTLVEGVAEVRRLLNLNRAS
jgi:alkanesulfonate monooxygenase SsuD/methylene tetrahydromethanopterin reductase-like flavin-dependent oxidoreductase (luciferase family)